MADLRQQILYEAIKPASTVASALDPALVVALSPNSPLPAGPNILGYVCLVDSLGNKALFNVKSEQQVYASSLDTIAALMAQLIIESKKQTFLLSNMTNIWIDDSEVPADQLFQ